METLLASVGKGGRNIFKDASVVQTLLNDCLHLMSPLKALSVDGKVGLNTNLAIEAFQQNVMGIEKPDGRVDPGGNTLNSLNRKVLRPPAPSNSAIFRNITQAFFKPTANTVFRFPLDKRPVQSYKTGMRRFGTSRSKGKRRHAGCDLYAAVGTPVYAMADGIVEFPKREFYYDTYDIAIQHGEYLVRYGELGTVSSILKKGASVKKGQQIGTVGYLKPINMSMLHLEMYTGKQKGLLTNRSNPPYMRRSDLIDPTPILDKVK